MSWKSIVSSVRSSRGFASLSVLAVVASISAVGLVGSGMSSSVLSALPGGAWLVSTAKGDVVLADGATGRGIARARVPNSAGSTMAVVHRGGYACVRSEDGNGEARVNCIDDATFGDAGTSTVKASQQVIRSGDAAYLIDHAQGLVRNLDAESMEPKGQPLRFNAPISTTADDGGRLLVVELETSLASVVSNGAAGEPVEVGEAKGDLFPMLANGEFAVVAESDARVSIFADGSLDRRLKLPGHAKSLLVPAEVVGTELALLARSGDGASVVALNLQTDKGRQVKVQGRLPSSSTVHATSAGLFVPDEAAGEVVRVDTRTGKTEVIDLGIGKGEANLEFFVKDDQLWANNPNGSKAVVIDSRGNKREVNKYDPDIGEVDPGWDEAPAAVAPDQPTESPESPESPQADPDTTRPGPAPAPAGSAPVVPRPAGGGGQTPGPATTTTVPEVPASAPKKEPVKAPGRPISLEGQAGNQSINLSWGRPTSGGAPERYELTCDPDCGVGGSELTLDGGAQARDLDGLRNGQRYSFSLVAANEAGRSAPVAASNLKPTAEVPNPPRNVSAVSLDDGRGAVRVSWSAPDEDGYTVDGFSVGCESSADVSPSSLATIDVGASTDELDLGPLEPGPGAVGWGYDDDAAGDWTCSVVTLGHDEDKSGSTPVPSESAVTGAFDPWELPAPLRYDMVRSGEMARGVEVRVGTPDWAGREGAVRGFVDGNRIDTLGADIEDHVPIGRWGDIGANLQLCVGERCRDSNRQLTVAKPSLENGGVAIIGQCVPDPNPNGTPGLGTLWQGNVRVDLKDMPSKFVSTYREFYRSDGFTAKGGWSGALQEPVSAVEGGWLLGLGRLSYVRQVRLEFAGLPGERSEMPGELVPQEANC